MKMFLYIIKIVLFLKKKSLCLDGWWGLFAVSILFLFYVQSIWCSHLSECLTLSVFYHCHYLTSKIICSYDVKMAVELRNKISAVFYRIFWGTSHFSVWNCTMHVMLMNAFWPCFSLWAVLSSFSSFICCLRRLLAYCMLWFFLPC